MLRSGNAGKTEDEGNRSWQSLSYEEKNRRLFLEQKERLSTFLEKGAISKAQYEKSLHDLMEKTGYR